MLCFVFQIKSHVPYFTQISNFPSSKSISAPQRPILVLGLFPEKVFLFLNPLPVSLPIEIQACFINPFLPCFCILKCRHYFHTDRTVASYMKHGGTGAIVQWVKQLTLHTADLGSIPRNPCGHLSPLGTIPSTEAEAILSITEYSPQTNKQIKKLIN